MNRLQTSGNDTVGGLGHTHTDVVVAVVGSVPVAIGSAQVPR